MKRMGGAVILLLLIAATVLWWFYWPIFQTKQRVKSALIDPDSAQFEEVVYNQISKVGCGSVNAKNRMGGYVGMTFFIATDAWVKFEPKAISSLASAEDQIANLKERIAYIDLIASTCDAGK